MKRMIYKKSRFLGVASKGASFSSYGIMVGLVSAVAIFAIMETGGEVENTFVSVNDSLNTPIASFSVRGDDEGQGDHGGEPEEPAPTCTIAGEYTATANPGNGSSDIFIYDPQTGGSPTWDFYHGNSGLQDTLVFETWFEDEVKFINVNSMDVDVYFPNQGVGRIENQGHGDNRRGFGTFVFCDGTQLDRQGARNKAAADAMVTGTVRGTDIHEDYFYDPTVHGDVVLRNDNYSGSTVDNLTVSDDVSSVDFVFVNSMDMELRFSDGDVMWVDNQGHGNNEYGFANIIFNDESLDRQAIRNKAAADAMYLSRVYGTDIHEDYAYDPALHGDVSIYNDNYSGTTVDNLTVNATLSSVDFIFVSAMDMELRFADGGVMWVDNQGHGNNEYGFANIIFNDASLARREIRDKAAADAMSTGRVYGTDIDESFVYTVSEHGNAEIINDNHASSVSDRLTITDANSGDVSFNYSGNNLDITFSDGAVLRIRNQSFADWGMKEIAFQNGEVLDEAEINAKESADTP